MERSGMLNRSARLRPVALALLLALAGTASSTAADVTDAHLRAELKGCWTAVPQGALAERQKDSNWFYHHERCFDGKLLGTSDGVTCDGYISFDCWEFRQRYGVSNGRLFIRAGDGSSRSCRIEISSDTLKLTECVESGVGGPKPTLTPSEDALFARSASK